MTDISDYIVLNSETYATICRGPFIPELGLQGEDALLVAEPRIVVWMDDEAPQGYWSLREGRNHIITDPPFAWVVNLNAIFDPGNEWKYRALNAFPRTHNSRDSKDFKEFLETNALRLSQETGELVGVVSIGTTKEHGEPHRWTDSFLAKDHTVARLFPYQKIFFAKPGMSNKYSIGLNVRRVNRVFNTLYPFPLEQAVKGLMILINEPHETDLFRGYGNPASAYITISSTSSKCIPDGVRTFDFYEGFPYISGFNISRKSIADFLDVFHDRVSSAINGAKEAEERNMILRLALYGMTSLGHFVDREVSCYHERGSATKGRKFSFPNLSSIYSSLSKLIEENPDANIGLADTTYNVGLLKLGADALRELKTSK